METPDIIRIAKQLLASILFDDVGVKLGQTYSGGNGGLLSRETVIHADTLRRAIDRWEREQRDTVE